MLTLRQGAAFSGDSVSVTTAFIRSLVRVDKLLFCSLIQLHYFQMVEWSPSQNVLMLQEPIAELDFPVFISITAGVIIAKTILFLVTAADHKYLFSLLSGGIKDNCLSAYERK